jgi:N-acetyl-alpha-D-muramate 1-phosphate uridylyltransferase
MPSSFRPHSAMVLAAGLGKRMRPLTETRPKPMVEVGGRPLIDHALDRLAAANVGTAVVNLHYLADQLRGHLVTRERPRIVLSDESDQLLETGGGIARALPRLGPNPFYILNSDSFWIEGPTPNLERLARYWDDSRMDALLMLASTVIAVGYDGRGDFTMDRQGRLMRRRQRQIAPFVYTGTAILSPRLFADGPTGPFSLNLLFDRAEQAGRLLGMRMDGLWLHVGTAAAIPIAEQTVAESAA